MYMPSAFQNNVLSKTAKGMGPKQLINKRQKKKKKPHTQT